MRLPRAESLDQPSTNSGSQPHTGAERAAASVSRTLPGVDVAQPVPERDLARARVRDVDGVRRDVGHLVVGVERGKRIGTVPPEVVQDPRCDGMGCALSASSVGSMCMPTEPSGSRVFIPRCCVSSSCRAG